MAEERPELRKDVRFLVDTRYGILRLPGALQERCPPSLIDAAILLTSRLLVNDDFCAPLNLPVEGVTRRVKTLDFILRVAIDLKLCLVVVVIDVGKPSDSNSPVF